MKLPCLLPLFQEQHTRTAQKQTLGTKGTLPSGAGGQLCVRTTYQVTSPLVPAWGKAGPATERRPTPNVPIGNDTPLGGRRSPPEHLGQKSPKRELSSIHRHTSRGQVTTRQRRLDAILAGKKEQLYSCPLWDTTGSMATVLEGWSTGKCHGNW